VKIHPSQTPAASNIKETTIPQVGGTKVLPSPSDLRLAFEAMHLGTRRGRSIKAEVRVCLVMVGTFQQKLPQNRKANRFSRQKKPEQSWRLMLVLPLLKGTGNPVLASSFCWAVSLA
jgi:hypothetical protein